VGVCLSLLRGTDISRIFARSFLPMHSQLFTRQFPFRRIPESSGLFETLGETPQRPTGVLIDDALWALMLDCWHHERERRPAFDIIVEKLGKIVLKDSNTAG
jgi:hypothetical protein